MIHIFVINTVDLQRVVTTPYKFAILNFVTELDNPSKWLVFKLIQRVFEVSIVLPDIVASFVKYDRDYLVIRRFCFDLDLDILSFSLQTELVKPKQKERSSWMVAKSSPKLSNISTFRIFTYSPLPTACRRKTSLLLMIDYYSSGDRDIFSSSISDYSTAKSCLTSSSLSLLRMGSTEIVAETDSSAID